MTVQPLRPNRKLPIKHATRISRPMVKYNQYRLVNTVHRDQNTQELGPNEIGRAQLRTTMPLLCDPYSKNRNTDSSTLMVEATAIAAGAGMSNRAI